MERMNIKKTIVGLSVLLLSSTLLFGNAVPEEHGSEDSHGKKSVFNPGTWIMEHVADSYEWHILTVGEKHISAPLPVILYSKTSGWNFFMSSKFHHGHSSYKGFRIAEEGPNEGSIVELDEHGHELEKLPLDLSLTKTPTALLISLLLLLWIFISIISFQA